MSDPYRTSAKKPVWFCVDGGAAFRIADVQVVVKEFKTYASSPDVYRAYVGPDRLSIALTPDQAAKLVAAMTDGESVLS